MLEYCIWVFATNYLRAFAASSFLFCLPNEDLGISFFCLSYRHLEFSTLFSFWWLHELIGPQKVFGFLCELTWILQVVSHYFTCILRRPHEFFYFFLRRKRMSRNSLCSSRICTCRKMFSGTNGKMWELHRKNSRISSEGCGFVQSKNVFHLSIRFHSILLSLCNLRIIEMIFYIFPRK